MHVLWQMPFWFASFMIYITYHYVEENELKRLSQLDSLRGIAAFTVAFIWHYQHFNPINGSPFRNVLSIFYEQGWLAVELFFCLSGFIFCYMYEQKIVENKISLKKFMSLRFARLYPLFLATMVFVAIFQIYNTYIAGNPFVYQNNDIDHIIQNLLFLQGGWFSKGASLNGVTWSLSVEAVCYIIFYIILARFKKKDTYLMAYGTVILVGWSVFYLKLNYPLINDSMARGFICFFIGSICYHINGKLQGCKKKALITSALIAILILIVVLYYNHMEDIIGNFQLVFSIFIAPAIILVSLNNSLFKKVLGVKPLVYLGEISYSIYLWHFPVQLVFNCINSKSTLNYSSYMIFFTYIIVTLIVSAASYELFEKRINNKLKIKINNTCSI